MNILTIVMLCIIINAKNVVISEIDKIVTDIRIYPYTVAILRKSLYISAGALIDENWVLTAADSLFFIREAVRTLRVRLGSTNFKHGGILTAIKYLRIHPYFDDNKPEFDMALIRLSETVQLTPNLRPIKLQSTPQNITAAHFTVTAWQIFTLKFQKNQKNPVQTEDWIKERQLLLVSHLHATASQDCLDQLETVEANRTDAIMCLDRRDAGDPCHRDTGAPVVLDGILWGIVSSWKSEDCDLEGIDSGTFVTLVSHVEINSWIHSILHRHRWSLKHTVDYFDNFI